VETIAQRAARCRADGKLDDLIGWPKLRLFLHDMLLAKEAFIRCAPAGLRATRGNGKILHLRLAPSPRFRGPSGKKGAGVSCAEAAADG
jgi:hypothetical protein